MILDLRAVPDPIRRELLAAAHDARPDSIIGPLVIRAEAGDGTATLRVEHLEAVRAALSEAKVWRNVLARRGAEPHPEDRADSPPREQRPGYAVAADAFNAACIALAEQRDQLEAVRGLPLEGPLPPGTDPEDRGDDEWTPSLPEMP